MRVIRTVAPVGSSAPSVKALYSTERLCTLTVIFPNPSFPAGTRVEITDIATNGVVTDAERRQGGWAYLVRYKQKVVSSQSGEEMVMEHYVETWFLERELRSLEAKQ